MTMNLDSHLQLFFDDNPEPFDDSNSSSGSESEESESDDLIEEIQPTRDYTKEVTKILVENINVSNENALALNRALQAKLLHVRGILEEILSKCEQKLTRNNEFLNNPKEKRVKLPYYRVCGIPYFKDLRGFPAPLNKDYKTRSESGELFLMDLQGNSIRYWTSADKSNLVRAVKSQLLDYLYPERNSENEAIRTATKNIELNTIRLTTLLQNAKDYQIDWKKVSLDDFKGRHSEKACYAMWHGYMQPDLNRNNWTVDENQRLMFVADKYNFQNWAAISNEMDGRSENQCFVQFQNTVNKLFLNSRKWTAHEDEMLMKAVEKHSSNRVINWNMVSGYFINRPKKSIYSRYKNVLSRDFKKGPFSREEDCILLAAIEEYGENFACIPMSLFPNRSRLQVKNRYLNSIKYHQSKRGWTLEDDETLYNFVKEHGKGKWADISKILEVHSRGSCRNRYITIERFLKKHPKATLKDVPRKNRRVLTDVSKDNWVEKMYELRVMGDVKAQESEERREKYRKRLMNRADNYRGILRSIDRMLYDIVKYSFNYRFMKPVKFPKFVELTLPFYLKTLKLDIYPKILNANRKRFTKEELSSLLSLKKSEVPPTNKLSYVPINWNTLLGMRALTILANNDSYRNITANNILRPCENVKAEKRFKEVFKKVFSSAVLLTRINPDALTNYKFVFKYNTNNDNVLLNSSIGLSENSCKRSSPSSTSDLCVKRQKI